MFAYLLLTMLLLGITQEGDWYRESNPLEKTLECVLRPCALPCHHAQLSAHQIATYLEAGGRLGSPGWYDGGLLTLAYDLGKRLLPAFDTPLGIPIHRVNLRKGVSRGVRAYLFPMKWCGWGGRLMVGGNLRRSPSHMQRDPKGVVIRLRTFRVHKSSRRWRFQVIILERGVTRKKLLEIR